MYFSFSGRLVRRALLLCLAFIMTMQAPALTLDQALTEAERQAPSLAAQVANRQAARSAAIPAGELPDPRVILGLQNLPIQGDAAWDVNAERMTMQRVGLMQEVPSRAKREARVELAQAGIALADAQQSVELLDVQQATTRCLPRPSRLGWLVAAVWRRTALGHAKRQRRSLIERTNSCAKKSRCVPNYAAGLGMSPCSS